MNRGSAPFFNRSASVSPGTHSLTAVVRQPDTDSGYSDQRRRRHGTSDDERPMGRLSIAGIRTPRNRRASCVPGGYQRRRKVAGIHRGWRRAPMARQWERAVLHDRPGANGCSRQDRGRIIRSRHATPLFEARLPFAGGRNRYIVTRDGQRFLSAVRTVQSRQPIRVTVNALPAR